MQDQVPTALDLQGVHVSTRTPSGGEIDLVRDGSLRVGVGEIVCLVGESGSGKSVLARSIMGLSQMDSRMRVGGSIRLAGEELVGAKNARLRELRGSRIAMIFQEPMSSLDPVYTVRAQLSEALRRAEKRRHHSRGAEDELLSRTLASVGIRDAERVLRAYSQELSGGMCQRVMIAMALLGEPGLLIADEPTTALDVTIQAQILALIDRVRRERNMSVLLVTHDMGIAAAFADSIAVMYAGRIVEQGSPDDILLRPEHPYTRGLLACIPSLRGPRVRLLPTVPGSVPHPSALPSGCAFHPRCMNATETCTVNDPTLEASASGRRIACWNPELTGEEVGVSHG